MDGRRHTEPVDPTGPRRRALLHDPGRRVDAPGVPGTERGDQFGQWDTERVSDGVHSADLRRHPSSLNLDDRLAVDGGCLREPVDAVAPLPPQARDLDAEGAQVWSRSSHSCNSGSGAFFAQ